jgi:hypothetical protein
MKKSTSAQSAVAAAVITAFLGLFAEVAQAQVVPTINVQETCRAAAGVMLNLSVGGGTAANDVQICVDSENKARDQIIKDWATYPASDRSGCIQPGGYLPSYVEWLTCFEMNKVVRDYAGQQGRSMAPLTNPDGSLTMPPLRSLGIMASSYSASARR